MEYQLILLTTDLFFVPVVRSAAANSALETLQIRATTDPKLIDANGEQVVAILVDLSAISLAELPQIRSALHQFAPSAELVAFGPHVHQIRLDAAREAGFATVMSRGELDHRLSPMIARWKAARPG